MTDVSENQCAAQSHLPNLFAPLLPGLLLAGAIASLALIIHHAAGMTMLSPMILSIMLAILFHNLAGAPGSAAPGIAFTLRKLLRIGIILLGFQLTLNQVLDLGVVALLMVTATLAATFIAIKFVGRLMKVDHVLSELIAAGTAVCGASAIIAANTVSKGSDEDVAYAVACVTILGSALMLLYPLIAASLGMPALGYGLWTGATVHEVAQVTAAGFQHGDAAGQYATVAKLSRVMMLAPLIVIMAFARSAHRHQSSRAHAPVPWFVFGFIAVVILNSLIEMPEALLEANANVTAFLLSMSLAAMGLQTDIGKLKAKGLRPFLLGVFGCVFISAFGYALLKLGGF